MASPQAATSQPLLAASVNTGSNNTFNIGITIEQYEVGLKRREQEIRAEVRAELAQADAETKLQNPEQSLAETNHVRR